MGTPQRQQDRFERVIGSLDLGIPPESVEPERMRRIRIISIGTLALVVVGFFTIFQYWFLQVPQLSVAIVMAMFAAGANLALLRATRRPILCGHIGLLILAGVLVYGNTHTGGFYEPNLSWLYVVPLSAAVLVNLRGAVVWTAIMLGVTAGFWLLPELDHGLVNQIPEPLRDYAALLNRSSAIVAIGMVAGSFVIMQRRTEHELGAANAELSRETAYVTLLKHAAVAANEATSFEQAMDDSVARVCEEMNWDLGHFYVVSDDWSLVSSGRYHGESGLFVRLREVTLAGRLRSGEGLPGRAQASGRPERVDDLLACGLKERARIAHEYGIRSAFAVPVKVNGRVAAVLEFAMKQPLPQDDRLLDVFASIGEQLGRVAERTALEDRLRRSQKMEAVGQLAAGLAHEINNPMSYVRANLGRFGQEWQKIRDALEKADLADAAEALSTCEELIEDCQEGIERTLGIVRDVREFSHVGGSHEEIDVPQLVAGAVREASSRAPGGVRVQRASDEIAGLIGSTSQLRQVLVNLIVNAIQAVGESGHVRVVAVADAGHAVFRVEDDGPGVESAAREHLYEPFFTTKGPGEGTGLGLYVSYEIVRHHGGQLSFRTEPGTGTVFELRIPLAIT